MHNDSVGRGRGEEREWESDKEGERCRMTVLGRGRYVNASNVINPIVHFSTEESCRFVYITKQYCILNEGINKSRNYILYMYV
jgi:hypothetical protein